MKNVIVVLLLSILCIPFLHAQPGESDAALLLRSPTIHQDGIAFTYAGDIWLISKNDNSRPKRLTVHPGVESNPVFSPDGKWIAFSGDYYGNTDVYLVPAEGGNPLRLTYHPDADQVRGWGPDGKKVLFASSRKSVSQRYRRLFTVSISGGLPDVLPMPMAERASFAPDGGRIAYTPLREAFHTWKNYRGGMTTPIWLFDLQTHEKVEIPHENASDARPKWVGNTVYFMSDRGGDMNLYAYHVDEERLQQLTRHDDFDVKDFDVYADEVVYEQAGRLHLLSTKTGSRETLHVAIDADIPGTRPHYVKAKDFIQQAEISPTGVRAVFSARGDILTLPAEKGNFRNITKTPGVCERYPAWSPDGSRIAYFSDEGGEYHLRLRDPKGLQEARIIKIDNPTFFYKPLWSPDNQKIAFTDKKKNLYYLNLETEQLHQIDSDTYSQPDRSMDPVWSPDSRWIAFTKRLENHMRAVFVYDLKNGRCHQITDGMSDATAASFSRDGKYLFFAASTDFALNTAWLDLSSYKQRVTRSLYAVVLQKDQPSPFAPESDDENRDENNNKADNEKQDKEAQTVQVAIDFEGIGQRIVDLPAPNRTYHRLQSAEDGYLFYLEDIPDKKTLTLHRFDMNKRENKPFLDGIRNYWISADGKKVLYQGPNTIYGVVDAAGDANVGDGKLNMDEMEVRVEPRAEWAQMFREVWRIERDFFYAENMHGLDWRATREKYKPFIKHVGHRNDLNYLFAQMMAEMTVGHNYVGGGDMPEGEKINVGLLGADYEIADGYYRFKTIYSGLNWNPDLRAPLTEPGVKVSEGDYLLAVNGQALEPPQNLFRAFENTAGKQTVITVNNRPTMEDAREVTVVPINSEAGLRNRAWIEGNRKRVDELTDGRVAYVYLPNTAGAGFEYFNRYYFAQLDKEAVIVDERFNGGGFVADYIIDFLDRPLLSYWATRNGKSIASPNASIFGPKTMIINQYAGSGGDALPLFFKRRDLGKLVGKRTWGGLVGIFDYPRLMDGGFVTSPRIGIYSPEGEWEVENVGVPPDIEVEMEPRAVIEGNDPQLEKAVEVIMKALKEKPVSHPPKPEDPVRVK